MEELIFQYLSNRYSCTCLGLRYTEPGKIQEMVRKEKACLWVMHEVSKREGLLTRLWFLLGNQVNSFIYSVIFIQYFMF